MNKRRKKANKKFRLVGEKVSNGNKKLDNFVLALFFIGLILTIWEIFIYRRTVIELEIPLLIFLIPGVFLTPILYKRINHIDGNKGHWILHYVLHTCTTGAFILFAFMASNRYLADNKIEYKTFKIESKGSLPGSKGHRNKRKPYVMINYEGLEKQLIFSYSETEKINSATKVNLTVKRGFLGFDIFEKYEAE